MVDISVNEPIIRTMRAKDLERIIEIDHKVLGRLRAEYWERKLELIENKSSVASLVAEMKGRVVGFIIGDASGWEYGVPENIGWIDTIGVDPEFQRHGVAHELMREMVDMLRKVGVDTVYTVVNWYDWSLLRFFHDVGFQKGEMIHLELKTS